MKAILINSSPVSLNSITAFTRNAIIISQSLKIPLVGTYEECCKYNAKDFDFFVIVGSSFYKDTAKIESWIRGNTTAKIVWINNEYDVSPNSEYARLMKDFDSILISNVIEKANKCKGYNQFHLVNLNALIWQRPNETLYKKYDAIYYGTYRSKRRIYLQKYLQDGYIHLSSSKKNLRRIEQLAGTNAIYCDKLSWQKSKESLNLFRYSIYIEDEFTHENYNHLANRFYECLMCNVVIFFDEKCNNTIYESGYNIDKKYIVSSSKQLKEKIDTFSFIDCLKEQKEWNLKAIEEKINTINQIKQILCLNSKT